MGNQVRGFNASISNESIEIDKLVKAPNKIIPGLSELTNNEISILIELVDNGFHEFIFYPDSFEFSDNVLEKHLELITQEEIVSAIYSLENKEYLHRIDLEPSIKCPSCLSSHFLVTLSCPECSSAQLKKKEVIEHPYCGYKNDKNSFLTGGKLVCPKCKMTLTRIEAPVDESNKRNISDINAYRIIRASYECLDCESVINEPKIDFKCCNCEIIYNHINAIHQIPIKYYIPERIFEKILTRNQVNLLIVEDFAPQADVVAMLLSSPGSHIEYNIAIAEDGSSALIALKEDEYDYIILDLGLPDVNGLELLKEIKHQWPDTKIIVLTGYDDIQIAVEAMKNGASEFFVKKTETIQNLPYILEKIISNN